MEKRDEFKDVDPLNNLRPDLTILDPPFKNVNKLELDVKITHAGSTPTVRLTDAEVEDPDAVLKEGAIGKTSKYGDLCTASKSGFKPLIFGNTGRMQPSGCN